MFFRVAKLHPKHSVLLVVACVAIGIWTMWYDPEELDSSLGLLLVVQLFLASTAFRARACAGHFDHVLVAGRSRRSAAFAHWAWSIAPGLAGWLVLVITGLLLGSAAWASALAGRRAAAFLIVSSLSWALGYRLPRGAAGVLWLTVLVAVLLQHNLRALSMSLDQGALGAPWTTAVLIVCPFLLIGNKPAVSVAPVAAALVVALLLLLLSIVQTTRLDVPLAERG
jgi:hypothetical protein